MQTISKLIKAVLSKMHIVFALFCFTPLVGLYAFLPMFIVFTSLSKKFARTHYSFGHKENGFVKAGRIVSTVAIPVGIVLSVIGLFYSALFLFV